MKNKYKLPICAIHRDGLLILAHWLMWAAFCLFILGAQDAHSKTIVLKPLVGEKIFNPRIQMAINSLGHGDTLKLAKGVYPVNIVAPGYGIRLKSNMTLSMMTGATLKAIPNDTPAATAVISAFNISNVNIIGGTIRGERYQHIGDDGEWGMGIWIKNSKNITVKNTASITNWGDGFYVSGTSSNVKLLSVSANSNRRDGASIVGCTNCLIKTSRFYNTIGHAPQCGLVVEPNGGHPVSTTTIDGVRADHNKNCGIALNNHRGQVWPWSIINNIIIANGDAPGNHGLIIAGTYPQIIDVDSLYKNNVKIQHVAIVR